jgi:two-component system, sensor histidine kinase
VRHGASDRGLGHLALAAFGAKRRASRIDRLERLKPIHQFVPQAAILDLALPAMNGYELAAALRADPRIRQIRLVALTGYGSDADRRRALEAGFDEHSVKPVDIDALLATLDRLLAGEAAPLAEGAA